MSFNPVRNAQAVTKAIAAFGPLVQEIIEAVGRRSDGGRKVTPWERDAIVHRAVTAVGKLIDDEEGLGHNVQRRERAAPPPLPPAAPKRTRKR